MNGTMLYDQGAIRNALRSHEDVLRYSGLEVTSHAETFGIDPCESIVAVRSGPLTGLSFLHLFEDDALTRLAAMFATDDVVPEVICEHADASLRFIGAIVEWGARDQLWERYVAGPDAFHYFDATSDEVAAAFGRLMDSWDRP